MVCWREILVLRITDTDSEVVRKNVHTSSTDCASAGHLSITGYSQLRDTFLGCRFPEENASSLRLPPVFGTNYLSQGPLYDSGVLPAGWARWCELFISTRESAGFPFLHQDMCATHAFSMQVQGIKRFILFPPSDSQYLYPLGLTAARSPIPHEDIFADKVSWHTLTRQLQTS